MICLEFGNFQILFIQRFDIHLKPLLFEIYKLYDILLFKINKCSKLKDKNVILNPNLSFRT
ncbi:MAG: hypothetical protein QG558_1628 [Campylobacterota bacterium]|nr:hypothetical protein [Campylobacterota bacterium]MDQ1338021.1 hypothetical protein [Campylobacterota bacterium]